MEDKMHIIITGQKQVGKSTLVRKITEDLLKADNRIKICGLETKKEIERKDNDGNTPVYIYEIGKPHIQSDLNLAGLVSGTKGRTVIHTDVFDRYAVVLESAAEHGNLIVIDEIGFMESKSEMFCKAILKLLDGNVPVIAAVRNQDTPFLNLVRNHSKCKCFYITEENRDDVGEKIKKALLGRTL